MSLVSRDSRLSSVVSEAPPAANAASFQSKEGFLGRLPADSLPSRYWPNSAWWPTPCRSLARTRDPPPSTCLDGQDLLLKARGTAHLSTTGLSTVGSERDSPHSVCHRAGKGRQWVFFFPALWR